MNGTRGEIYGAPRGQLTIDREPDGETHGLPGGAVTISPSRYKHGTCGAMITQCGHRFYCHKCGVYWNR